MKVNQFAWIFVVLFNLLTVRLSAQSQHLTVSPLSSGQLPPHAFAPLKNAISTKYYEIDFSYLNSQPQQNYSISLPDGGLFSFHFNQLYTYTAGSTGWYGQSTNGHGDVIVSFYQGNISSVIVDDQQRKYVLQQINQSNIFAMSQVNVEGMQENTKGEPDYILESGSSGKNRVNANVCLAGSTCAGASTIDLMVLGNADAIVDGGGTVGAFTANVTTAVTEMNTAYTNSGGTNLTFNLVHCNSIVFPSTASYSNDLSNFSSNASVQALRNTHYADLVSLWVGAGSYVGICGVGNLNTNPTNYNSNSAYTVCDYSCAMTNLTYAHECGHNMGLRHDYYVDGSTTPCAHHHGYVNQVVIPGGSPSSGRWRTIMAYNNECSDNGFNCTRLARWSNPALNYLGDPTGIAIGSTDPSNEIYGFERFRCVVESFRTNLAVPVRLTHFEASPNGDQINLFWRTASEENNKGFSIEMKRTVSEDFNSVGYVVGKGNSAISSDYHFSIYDQMAGTYYFRLRQLDTDNQSTLSEVVQVTLNTNHFQVSLQPNPVQDQFTVSLFQPQNQNLRITMLDVTGHPLRELFNGPCNAGRMDIPVSVSGIPKGLYFCHIQSGAVYQNVKVVVK